MFKFLQPKIFLPFFLILFSFSVYWFTKPPSILWIDSGTMIAASANLGIPNPPGFPFYMMVSHIFGLFLPFLSHLVRLELFTIIFSVAGLFLIYKLIILIFENDFFFHRPAEYDNKFPNISKYKHFAAFFGAFSLAFSYQWWSQSQNTEAFIFTDFFLILFIYLILKVEKKRKELLYSNSKTNIAAFAAYFFRNLVIITFLFALAAGANPTIAVLVPALLYVIYLNRRLLSLSKLIILGSIFFLTLALVYSYLPLRASAWPFVNWGNPQTLNLFIGHLRGEGLNIYEPQTNSINGFTGSPVVFFQSVSHFVFLLLIQFTPFLLPFLFSGAYFIFKKNRRLFLFLISVIAIDVVYSGVYFSGNQESWFILPWIICAIFIGVGFYFIINVIPFSQKYKKFLLILCFLPFLVWLIPLNRSWHTYTSDYGKNLYSSLGKNAILIGVGDFTNSLGYYYREGDKFRPDVTPITANTFYVNRWYRDDLRHSSNIIVSAKIEKIIRYKTYDEYNRAMNELINDNIDKRPIYITHLSFRASALAGTDAGQFKPDSRFRIIPHGLSVQIVRVDSKEKLDLKSFDYVFNAPLSKPPIYLEKNYNAGFKNLLNDYSYGYEALGDYFLNSKDYPNSLKYYKMARSITPNNIEILSRFGQYYGFTSQPDIARQYFEFALRLAPDNLSIMYNLAHTLVALGKAGEARQYFDYIQKASPGSQIALDAKQQESQIQAPAKAENRTYSNPSQNYSFNYPNSLTLSKKEDRVVFLTNGAKDKSMIDIFIFGEKINAESLTALINKSPIKTQGTLLAEQPVGVSGFKATAQVWGHEGITTQFYVLQKGNWVYLIRLDLQDANSIQVFNQVLGSFKSLHD